MTGTCTKKECPFCKPKACCGAHHKHYVMNTASLEGVCVRHNDDCTPVCVPLGDSDPEARRVCSKGCNMLVKVERTTQYTTQSSGATDAEAEKFELVVCQADKRVVCDGSSTGSQECTTEKSVKPVALCDFSVGLWNLGGTCIANHVHQYETPQCPNSNGSAEVQDALDAIATQCRLPKDIDAVCGSSTGTTNDAGNAECEVAVKEVEYCKRLAMSY
jgi:hypothetical protein